MGRKARDNTRQIVAECSLPPACLILAVLGSIFSGLARPKEAFGAGAAGSLLVVGMNRTINLPILKDVLYEPCASLRLFTPFYWAPRPVPLSCENSVVMN